MNGVRVHGFIVLPPPHPNILDSDRFTSMKSSGKTVIGIDVGGREKGFHAVALRNGEFKPHLFKDALSVADWCLVAGAQVIAIDAPCAWATSGGSRLAERSLAVGGQIIQCFKTPTRTSAQGRAFYGWVFNGEQLYQRLFPHYRLFDGSRQRGKIVLETFPHAVVCALAGNVVSARPKASTRRQMLRDQGYDDGPLSNIDFVDAALCALTAERHLLGRTHPFGDREEGYIVVPN
jgi:predicted RNase H-like nuclease